MSGGIEVRVSGLEGLAAALRELPPKISRRVADKTLREAAKPMLDAARAKAPALAASTQWRRAGALKKAIRISRLRVPGDLNRGVTIGVKLLNRRQMRAARLASTVSRLTRGVKISKDWHYPFWWYFLEHGWHATGRRNGRGLTRRDWRKSARAASKFIKMPFLKPAFDEQHRRFLDQFGSIMGRRIEEIWRGS